MYVCIQVSTQTRDIESLVAGVTSVCEPPGMSGGYPTGPLQEQYSFLTAELSYKIVRRTLKKKKTCSYPSMGLSYLQEEMGSWELILFKMHI